VESVICIVDNPLLPNEKGMSCKMSQAGKLVRTHILVMRIDPPPCIRLTKYRYVMPEFLVATPHAEERAAERRKHAGGWFGFLKKKEEKKQE
jgi:hypothetical protein